MAITPPPNGGTPLNNSGGYDLLDAIWGIYHPAMWLVVLTSALSASFALGVPMVKGVGSLILCGISMFLLYKTSNANGCTATKWRYDLKDWAQMALTVHAIYFGLIHDLVSK